MKTQRMVFSCHSCGIEVERSPGQPPCEVLKDWLTVSYWKGLGSIEHYNFCSFSCLKSWADAQVPRVPEVFVKYFSEDEG